MFFTYFHVVFAKLPVLLVTLHTKHSKLHGYHLQKQKDVTDTFDFKAAFMLRLVKLNLNRPVLRMIRQIWVDDMCCL